MNFRKIITVSLAFATIISCKKQKEETTEIYQSKLPNYSNVDLSKVFTPAESALENESLEDTNFLKNC